MLKTEKGSGRGGQNEKFGFCKVNLAIWRTIFIWPFRGGAHNAKWTINASLFYISAYKTRVWRHMFFSQIRQLYERKWAHRNVGRAGGGEVQSIKDNSCCCWLLTATCAGRAEINAGSAAWPAATPASALPLCCLRVASVVVIWGLIWRRSRSICLAMFGCFFFSLTATMNTVRTTAGHGASTTS